MSESTSFLEVEPTGDSTGYCDCCGNQSRIVSGLVYEGDRAVACYFVHWTIGTTLESHPANFDLIYGAWGEGASAKDRCAISLIHFENEDGPGVSVIDADERPIANSELIGAVLGRDDVVGTPLAQHVFAIFDAVLLQDKRLG